VQHFLKATEQMSQSKTPLLYQVILIIDALTQMLETVSNNKALFLAVCAAATKGIVVLNKYYAKTDESIMYRCAMSMSPISISSSEFILNSIQCFIPDIRWLISITRNGHKNGSQPLKTFFVTTGALITNRQMTEPHPHL